MASGSMLKCTPTGGSRSPHPSARVLSPPPRPRRQTLRAVEDCDPPRPFPVIIRSRAGGGGNTPPRYGSRIPHAPADIPLTHGHLLPGRRGTCSPTLAADVPLASPTLLAHPPAALHSSRAQAVASLALRFGPSAGRPSVPLCACQRWRAVRSLRSVRSQLQCPSAPHAPALSMLSLFPVLQCIHGVALNPSQCSESAGKISASGQGASAPPGGADHRGFGERHECSAGQGFRDGHGGADPRRRIREVNGASDRESLYLLGIKMSAALGGVYRAGAGAAKSS